MNKRSFELRRLVRALRAEVARMHHDCWHAPNDHQPRRLLSGQIVTLHEAAQALQLADDGTYGTCIDCDRRIPLVRLRAKPTAIRCIGCQQRLEASTAA